MTIKISEEDLQKQVVDLLRSKRIMCFSVPNGFYAGKGKNRFGYVNKMKATGLLPGVADIIVLLPKGRTVFLELKAKKGKQQDTQIDFENNVRILGFDYHIIKSLDEIKELFNLKCDL